MSPISSYSVSFAFVYSLTRVLYHLILHVAVIGVGLECPLYHPRVYHLPLCTHSQGYFITYYSM
jgi:hypothetical protein